MVEKIQQSQNRLKSGVSIPLLDSEDLIYLQKPIGRALYKNTLGRPRKREEDKAKPGDIIICDVCGNKFIRSHRSSHKKTKVHQAYENMNRKLIKMLLNTENN